jgi:ketopantoate reductase
MKKPVVLTGVGEMGGVFARAILRSGYPVFPVLRGDDLQAVAAELSDPEMVIVAVAEADLHPLLQVVPPLWKDRLVLLQNELLPADWQRYDLQPTVISVWFEKKKGQDVKVLIPSPVYGKHARLLVEALASIDIAARELDSDAELLHELVLKNVYILTTNIAGLEVGGTVGELWHKHQSLAREVAAEVVQLQEKLCGQSLDTEQLIDAMLVAFNGDLQHGCMGRSAPARLQRALQLADEYGLALPRLRAIAAART